MPGGGGPAAQLAQTQATPWRLAGIRSRTSSGTGVEKHQHVLLPAAMPHALPPPHSGQRVGSGDGSLTRPSSGYDALSFPGS